MPPRTVVIAPDSFKGTATSIEAAQALAAGWSSARPADVVRLVPMADGGEGTLDAFEIAVPGSRRMPVTVQGPDNRRVAAHWLLLPDGTGVVELANTSGITLLDPLQPLDAHTLGFGEAIAAALDFGVHRLVLAIGGSSSTDGGVGALAALGASFTTATGQPVRLGNRALGTLARANLKGLRPLPAGGAVILSDVTSPLLGPDGAASVFGPQKGANEAQVIGLESNLVRLARLLPVDPDTPGAGAAGGTGFGLLAWGATIQPGAGAVGEALNLPAAVAEADIVITGEGRYDSQSAAGKVPSYVAELAAAAGARAFLVAGAIQSEPVGFAASQSLTELAGDARVAKTDTVRWLRAAGELLARSAG